MSLTRENYVEMLHSLVNEATLNYITENLKNFSKQSFFCGKSDILLFKHSNISFFSTESATLHFEMGLRKPITVLLFTKNMQEVFL